MNPVDQYIMAYPENVQALLKKVRTIIKDIAPEAVESIGYGIPGYKLNGKPLVYFGAFKDHLGFYATPAGHSAFAEELSKYKQGKGSVQFSFEEPIPFDLIARIVEFKVIENLKKR